MAKARARFRTPDEEMDDAARELLRTVSKLKGTGLEGVFGLQVRDAKARLGLLTAHDKVKLAREGR